jgi:gliding motility-associated-like protein
MKIFEKKTLAVHTSGTSIFIEKTPNLFCGGKVVELAVTWEETKLNIFKRGSYILLGTLVIPSDLINPKGLTASIEIIVQEKEAPKDVVLSQNVFDPDPDDYYQEIGFFTVVDPLDQTHLITLIAEALDNKYFEVKDGKLYWNSPKEFVGKKEFQIKIRVEDRDGNVLEKTFQITRTRKRPTSGIPEIYNAFTPDGDGVNDTWGVPDLKFFPSIRVEVFDRNGKMVFFTEDGEKRWDATVDGKRVPSGTYYWIQKDSETGEIKKGFLTIVKN